MKRIFTPGDRIGGYCNGLFGRDDYSDKTCIFVNDDMAVFQYEDGSGCVINKEDISLMDPEIDQIPQYSEYNDYWKNWYHSSNPNYEY